MAIVYAEPIRGWRFILFNAVLAMGHMIVLFNIGS